MITDEMKYKVTEGDIVLIHDTNWDYTKRVGEPYKAIILWKGFNNQPLITKTGKYEPIWSTYESIKEIIGHTEHICLN